MRSPDKIKWQGAIQSVQPRTRVWRYVVDNRTHYHLGFNLWISGEAGGEQRDFVVAVSDKQHAKHQFRIGDVARGTAWPKKYEKREFADFYRAGALKVLERPDPDADVAPPLAVYEERGARQLSKAVWKRKCMACYWANMANVEIQWDFDRDIKKYRFETFCYGPKSCPRYRMGPARAVPYRNRGSALDDGMLDEFCTQQRDE